MSVMALFFTSRLFASIVPHVTQLEHDAPILIRSFLIVGISCYVIWLGLKYFKKKKSPIKMDSDKNL